MSKRIVIVRNSNVPINPKNYNSQEIGIAKSLIYKGFDCDIVLFSDENKLQKQTLQVDKGIINIYLMPGIKMFDNGIFLKHFLNGFFSKYDVIQTSEYSQIMTVLFALKYKKKVTLYHGLYTDGPRFFKNLIYRIYDFLFVKFINNRINGIISKSELSTKYLLEKGFSNIHTIGIGLDDGNINNDESSVNIGFNNKLKKLLYVGVLNERKNIIFSLKVFKKILSIDDEYTFTIVGDGKKEEKDMYFSYAKENGLMDKIEYYSKISQNEIKSKFLESSVFLLPSKEEIFGMVLLESMYFGIPVISSYNGGSSTVIENNVNGLIVEEFDIEIWSSKIIGLIDSDLEYNKISKKSIKTIKNNFLWNKIIDKYIKVYRV